MPKLPPYPEVPVIHNIPPAGFGFPIYEERIVRKGKLIVEEDDNGKITKRRARGDVTITRHVASAGSRFVSGDGVEILCLRGKWKVYGPDGRRIAASPDYQGEATAQRAWEVARPIFVKMIKSAERRVSQRR